MAGGERPVRLLALALGLPTISCQGPGFQRQNPWEEALQRQGYNVVPGVLSAGQLRRARRALHDRWLQDPAKGGRFGKERQYSLLELDPVFAEFLEAIPKDLEGMMTRVMGPWILGAFDIYKFHPVTWNVPREVHIQQKAMSLHSDYPYGHTSAVTNPKVIPNFHPPTMQLIFMVDDFTYNNGATVMLPGSHKGRRIPQGMDDRLRILNQTVTVTGKAGDLIVYIGQTWHGNGLNTAHSPRVGVIAQCLPWYFKPMQSFMYTLPYRIEKGLSQRVRVRLGLKFSHYLHHTSTMGYNTMTVQLYRLWSFLWDMLYQGYRTRSGSAFYRRCSLAALSVPPVFFLVARLEAVRLFVAILLGMFLGLAMAMERFGL